MIALSRQLELLFQHVYHTNGRLSYVYEVAQATDIAEQTLLNLLHDRATQPRLNTLLTLCDYFGISLDYFSLPTEKACLWYLASIRKLGKAPLILEHIEREAVALSPQGIANVLAILQWRIRSQS